MKKPIKLDIVSPCQERLGNFSPIDQKAFCQKCSMDVVDFTQKTDREILEYLSHTSGKTCGRLKESQLKVYPSTININPNTSMKWLGASILGISLCFPTIEAQAQAREQQEQVSISEQGPESDKKNFALRSNIKGQVTEAGTDEGLPGVNVVLKGTVMGTTTDLDGNFELQAPLRESDILTFSFIGLETVERAVTNSDFLTVEMKAGLCAYEEVVITGEVATDHLYTSRKNLWQKIAGIFKP